MFVSKCKDKFAFHYPLATYPLAITDPSGTLYQPTAKHLFRNELIKLSWDSIAENTAKNAVHIDDGMGIVQSVASQKSWGDYFLKWLTQTRVHNPSKVHIAFNNYTDNQTFYVKQTKRVSQDAGKGK